jgi:hypothetical protein
MDSCPSGVQTTQRAFNISISSIPQPCQSLNIISQSSLSGGTVGLAYSKQVQTSGGQAPISFSLVSGTLPSGLTLGTNGFISGTPATAGSFTFSVRAADSCFSGIQTAQKNFTLTMRCSPADFASLSTLPSGVLRQSYMYQLQAVRGQPPYIFSEGGSLPPGLTLSSSGLISGLPQRAGAFRFPVTVTDSCTPGFGQGSERLFLLEIDETPPLPPSACVPMNISSPATLKTGIVGQAYTEQIQRTGGSPPVAYKVLSGMLPPGLTLGQTGLMAGTPTTTGTFRFTIGATDSCPKGKQSDNKAFTVVVNEPTVNVTITPQSFSIARNRTNAQTLFYTFTAPPQVTITLNSSRGTYLANGTIIGEVLQPLNAQLRGGSGSVSETINIPVSVTKRAEELGTTRISFARDFTITTSSATARRLLPAQVPVVAQAAISVTTEAGADLSIERINLYFENRRSEITVKRNQPALKAYAEIRYIGSGLLQGFWEVDGRIIETVNRHLVYGEYLTLETPDIPSLPTFVVGSHIVRFIITTPPMEIEFPHLLYHVTAEDYELFFPIHLISPLNHSEMDYEVVTFSWESAGSIETYLIEFLVDRGERQTFSAYLRGTEYALPSTILADAFVPGGSYHWRVTGFDTENNIIGKSEVFRFTFRELTSFLPNQILVGVEDTPGCGDFVEDIAGKYGLRLVQFHEVASLDLRVALMETEKDLMAVISAISKEEGVVLAQPNYIYRTMAEPMSDMQNLHRILALGEVHQKFRGRDVRVGVIDTGVDLKHRDLKERVILSRNFVDDFEYRAENHGTAVAGIIGAEINGFGITGIAPEADMLALRACKQVSKVRPEGECSSISLSRAIDTSLIEKAKVVNMSVGSPSPDSLVVKLLEVGTKRGVLFVAPVGNMPWQREVTFPASHPAVVSVGGIDEKGKAVPNSEIVSKADVSAPWRNIFTTVPGDKHNFMSGTSLSSAMVSGILAVAAGKDSGITRDTLPPYEGDICRWQEELLKISLCD